MAVEALRLRRLAVGVEVVRKPLLVAFGIFERQSRRELPARPVAVDPTPVVLKHQRLQGEQRAGGTRPAPYEILHPQAVLEECRDERPRARTLDKLVELVDADALQHGVSDDVGFLRLGKLGVRADLLDARRQFVRIEGTYLRTLSGPGTDRGAVLGLAFDVLAGQYQVAHCALSPNCIAPHVECIFQHRLSTRRISALAQNRVFGHLNALALHNGQVVGGNGAERRDIFLLLVQIAGTLHLVRLLHDPEAVSRLKTHPPSETVTRIKLQQHLELFLVCERALPRTSLVEVPRIFGKDLEACSVCGSGSLRVGHALARPLLEQSLYLLARGERVVHLLGQLLWRDVVGDVLDEREETARLRRDE